MRNIYFSQQGQYFKTPGDEVENRINVIAATEVIRKYITVGGHQSEVEEALNWLDEEFPKVRSITKELRNYIFLDDLFGFDEKGKVCGVFYNRLIKRLEKQDR